MEEPPLQVKFTGFERNGFYAVRPCGVSPTNTVNQSKLEIHIVWGSLIDTKLKGGFHLCPKCNLYNICNGQLIIVYNIYHI